MAGAFQPNAFQLGAFQMLVGGRIVSTSVLHLPIDCVLAGQQIFPTEIGREYSLSPRNEKRVGRTMRSGVRALSSKSTFTVTSSRRGYD